ncbi:unnamed protein product [Kluyveromyces dobzhanskii CBS 2104]|uniref:WGS project CCBQ000000000 data, contig 00015 n=1 Tax=Kluyveromyces dobzhanskii CBS 2104 TaxID=1427455 RepID=A0A0A8LCA1_9SACH|nr:unnamed protein product [Kluyveromyces dobzhanskii CBS 2104]
MSKKFASEDGSFKRQVSSFRETISATHPIYKPEKGRYWLYVSLACPWAHRALITRVLKGLTSVIGISVVHWHLDEKGWRFLPYDDSNKPDDVSFTPSAELKPYDELSNSGVENHSIRYGTDGTIDHNYHFERLSQLYFKSEPEYSARYTVPVLWDLKTQTIVNNESSEIIRILNSGVFDKVADPHPDIDLLPKELESEIDEINSWVYDNINNGVYKTGFAEKQEIYEKEVTNLFKHLDKVESMLKGRYETLKTTHFSEEDILKSFYLLGNQLTEADLRLYPTLIRFDPVYVQHFKTNLNTIRSGYPYIHLWLRNLYWNDKAFHDTTNFNHIKWHYTRSHTRINPLSITPLGPSPNILPL